MTTPQEAALYLAQEAGIPVNDSHPLTDYGNAERLVDANGQDLRYLFAWHKWLAWDGRRWEVDADGEVMRRAKTTVRALYQEATEAAQGASAEPDDILRKQYADIATTMLKWARKSESNRLLEAMIALARSEPTIAIAPAALDADHFLFNCFSGTIDLRTGELSPPTRDSMITKLAPTEYDPTAQCPQWLAFLDRIMAGNQALIDFLKRSIGYSLTGVTTEHALFVLYGTGRNGKSTFLNTFLALMGDYAHQTPPDILMVRHWDTHPTERVLLHGIRYAPAIETQEGRQMDEVMTKELTGGDMVVARRMREDFWQFFPTHHIWLATNHKPTIRGTDLGIWSRIRLIPFSVTIPLDEQDRSLADKLKLEWPGILDWAVQGCLEWQAQGLMEPPEVWQATSEYRDDMDVLGVFIADRCNVEEGARSTSKELYDSYQAWSKATGEKTITKRDFGARLLERGFRPGKGTKGIRLWRGIRLFDATEQAAMQSNMFADDEETQIQIGGVTHATSYPPGGMTDPGISSPGGYIGEHATHATHATHPIQPPEETSNDEIVF